MIKKETCGSREFYCMPFLNMFICHKGILYIVITFSLHTKYYTQKNLFIKVYHLVEKESIVKALHTENGKEGGVNRGQNFELKNEASRFRPFFLCYSPSVQAVSRGLSFL